MKKRRRLKKKPVIILVVCIILIIGLIWFMTLFGAVSNSSHPVSFTVEEGETYYSIAPKLKEAGLIRSEFAYKLYIRLQSLNPLKEGNYNLNQNMDLRTLIHSLSGDETFFTDEISITFPEGRNVRQIASIIAENTNHTEEEVYTLLQDETYLNELIETYWFITEEVKNPDIYYSLEGYLLPDTYRFTSADVDLKELFKKMFDETETRLEDYRSLIEASGYTYHQILTIASMAELEASTTSDREMVARVFYNRLESSMALGSDVTTYYGAQVDMGSRDLYVSEINEENAYNTRVASSAGHLPVGPICNPGIDTILASIQPAQNDYYYFVADKNKKVYFNETSSGHNQTIADLKEQGLWLTWE